MPRIALLSLALLMTLFLSTAFAVPDSVVGERNFERALRAHWANRDMEKAREHYVRAADAFARLMETNRAAGKSTRLSRLLMAGISQFRAERYSESAATMQVASAMDDDAWESWLYGGLSRAMMDDAKGALNMWRRFPLSSSQRSLLPALRKQIASLDAGETTLQDAADEILRAEDKQFRWNYFTPRPRRGVSPQERCSGRFWWRFYYETCDPRTHSRR